MSPWWPWADSGDPPRTEVVDPGARYALTTSALNALHKARVDRVNEIVTAALTRYGQGPFPADVLLDIKLALAPINMRPPAPVIPGPDGARHG